MTGMEDIDQVRAEATKKADEIAIVLRAAQVDAATSVAVIARVNRLLGLIDFLCLELNQTVQDGANVLHENLGFIDQIRELQLALAVASKGNQA